MTALAAAAYPSAFLSPSVDSNLPISSVDGTWWVAYLRSKAEMTFVAEMEALGLPAYCPVVVRRHWDAKAARRVTLREPAFPNYAFVAVRGPKDSMQYASDLYAARGSDRVVRRTFIEVVDQRKFVHEMGQIQKVLAIDPALEACGMLVPGRRVRVTSGPFIGIEGILERATKNKVHVRVSQMQSSIVVEIAPELLELAE